jgi:hypothetical protein
MSPGVQRLIGILLFLPVPLVLWLFTRAPLGPWPSEALGVAIVLTHPLYARAFARRAAPHRCLWCAAAAAAGPELTVHEPLGTTAWRACSASHRDRLRSFFGWAGRHRTAVRFGILGTLAVFLVAAPLASRGRLGPLTHADLRALFQVGIAATVLPLAVFGPRDRPEEAPRPPFPVHVPALIGTAAALWLFRLVGLVWLGLGLTHLVRRVLG